MDLQAKIDLKEGKKLFASQIFFLVDIANQFEYSNGINL
jgi:hypothetical protein